MHLIKLSDYTLAPIGKGSGINKFHFTLSKGDVCSIHADSPDNACLLLKGLATLVRPVTGIYSFKGKKLDFSDAHNLLPFKKKIGYISADSALVSSITLRENLLLMRYYFENSLSIDLDEKTEKLCNAFNIQDKLDMRSSEIGLLNARLGITIREITKSPDVLLIERPEDFIDHSNFDLFSEILSDFLMSETAIVFFSCKKAFIEKFYNKKIIISDRELITTPRRP